MGNNLNKYFTEEKQMVPEYKRRCLTVLIIGEMPIKTTMRETENLVRVYIIVNTSVLMTFFYISRIYLPFFCFLIERAHTL